MPIDGMEEKRTFVLFILHNYEIWCTMTPGIKRPGKQFGAEDKKRGAHT